MAEMTDNEVEARLGKYRMGKRARRIVAIGGAVLAALLVIAGIVCGMERAERRRVAALEQKPLREWTAQEQERYGELYQRRLKSEPIDFRGIFKTGVYSPIGGTTVKGVWIKKAIILLLFLSSLSILLLALGIRMPWITYLAYLCSSGLGLFVLYILVLHFWRMLVQ
jgi:pilus assembly protein TadC